MMIMMVVVVAAAVALVLGCCLLMQPLAGFPILCNQVCRHIEAARSYCHPAEKLFNVAEGLASPWRQHCR